MPQMVNVPAKNQFLCVARRYVDPPIRWVIICKCAHISSSVASFVWSYVHKLTPAFTHERDSGGYRNKAMGGGGGGGAVILEGRHIFGARSSFPPP